MLYEFDHHITSIHETDEKQHDIDKQIMRRIQDRDPSALAELHDRHSTLLRSVIGRVLHNDFDVDEVLQDTFLQIWDRADSYTPEKGKPLGWMLTLARRRAIDKMRRKQAYWRVEEKAREDAQKQEPAMQHGADEDAISADLMENLERCLASLPDAQREALQFAYFRGMSQREIAEKTGAPLGTIKTRLELGLRKVRASVTAAGGMREWLHGRVRHN